MKTQTAPLLALILCGLALTHAPRDGYTLTLAAGWIALIIVWVVRTLKRDNPQ